MLVCKQALTASRRLDERVVKATMKCRQQDRMQTETNRVTDEGEKIGWWNRGAKRQVETVLVLVGASVGVMTCLL